MDFFVTRNVFIGNKEEMIVGGRGYSGLFPVLGNKILWLNRNCRFDNFMQVYVYILNVKCNKVNIYRKISFSDLNDFFNVCQGYQGTVLYLLFEKIIIERSSSLG